MTIYNLIEMLVIILCQLLSIVRIDKCDCEFPWPFIQLSKININNNSYLISTQLPISVT